MQQLLVLKDLADLYLEYNNNRDVNDIALIMMFVSKDPQRTTRVIIVVLRASEAIPYLKLLLKHAYNMCKRIFTLRIPHLEKAFTIAIF